MEKIKNFYLTHKETILEIITFIIVGGINTLMGGILLPHLFVALNLDQTFIIFNFFIIDMPLIYGFLLWFTAAYFLQAKFVFHAKFELKRFLIYPLTQIPNLILNQVLLFLFKDVLKIMLLNGLIARALAAIIALPIMFILVRLVIKPLKKKNN